MTADTELLRGLAGLREAIKDWGDNMRSETMADLLAHVDRIELSVAQGQGWVHKWDRNGERCVHCGDKRWMGGPCSGPRPAAPAQGADRDR